MAVVTGSEPRELTQEEREARAKECYAIQDKIVDSMARGRAALWDLAENLYEFNERNGWTALGYESQKEWLAQPEIGLTRSEYFRLVRRHREMRVTRQLPTAQLVELEPSKLDIVMPTIEDAKVPVDEVLADVRELGARDLREKYIPREVLNNGNQAQNNGAGSDDDVIDGEAKTITTDDQPVNAADVPGAAEAAGKADEAFMHAAGVVDSWIDLGGDRRKAKRNWSKVKENHPLLSAIRTLDAFIEGGDDAPEKEAAQEAWTVACSFLGFDFSE